ncbi:triose-phosphate isomerase [Gammaproteobacteria bacterium]|nr:triose-phosphate isomerase [Gammaproteobacteria bacterium]
MHEVSGLLAEYSKLDVAMDVFVPYPYLGYAAELFHSTALRVGAQNVSVHQRGAYTSQVSHEILQHFKVETVLLGHQEVGDTLEDLEKKIAASQSAGMNVVYCVSGSGKDQALRSQLARIKDLEGVTIAYEPAGAIGSGKAAKIEDIACCVKFIKAVLAEDFPSNFNETAVLYGGSVNNKNCRDILAKGQVDGLLIGSASLDLAVLKEVIEICKQY